ncbi:MAG: hypothetical protein GXZ06_10530 [Tissierellia bacterium]|nr:hypothetical protein [Tissierellia bacterium]
MEDSIKKEEFFSELLDGDNNRIYNFMINASNQANLANKENISPVQFNSIFVVIHPYYIERLNFESLNLDIRMNENGSISINNKNYNMIEIEPGIKVFGIYEEKKEA